MRISNSLISSRTVADLITCPEGDKLTLEVSSADSAGKRVAVALERSDKGKTWQVESSAVLETGSNADINSSGNMTLTVPTVGLRGRQLRMVITPLEPVTLSADYR